MRTENKSMDTRRDDWRSFYRNMEIIGQSGGVQSEDKGGKDLRTKFAPMTQDFQEDIYWLSHHQIWTYFIPLERRQPELFNDVIFLRFR